MHYLLDDIVRQFDPATFARGERYARQGMVIDTGFAGNMITGEVEGSKDNVYRQTIFVETDRHGVRFDSECSCPMDRKVRDEIDRKGFARSQIVILDALLKLRQVYCDPRLLKTGSKGADSAKLGVLMELLETLSSEQRRILVFSQFTSMLALIADELRERSVDFVMLTGDTDDRSAPVAAFQQGQAAVFLISLKAGGVGLNLTAADTVIHYDPWWNPASENQATDRAWRIGQEQPVFVYKLIARGTLEEKIQDMQRRKGELAQNLLDADGGLSPAIGADDLQAIFAPLAS